jgi:hypothetical protein
VSGGVRKLGVACHPGDDLAKLIAGQPSTVVGGQQIGGLCTAWVWQRPSNHRGK